MTGKGSPVFVVIDVALLPCNLTYCKIAVVENDDDDEDQNMLHAWTDCVFDLTVPKDLGVAGISISSNCVIGT